jgi:bifunctional glutamyl/prolyl-tRNA synthetase
VLDKDDDFKQYCTHQTEFEFNLRGDPEMKLLKKGEIIQISRRGFYIVDQAWDGDKPLVLFNIPEGNKNEPPTTYMSITGQKYPTKLFEEAALLQKKSTG